MTTNARMDAAQFEEVAKAECKWSEANIQAVRSILVGGHSAKQAGEQCGISAKHARVLVSRFLKKTEAHRLKSFMAAVPPLAANAAIEPHAREVLALRDKGYEAGQIVTYLASLGVDVTAAMVRKFLRSNRA